MDYDQTPMPETYDRGRTPPDGVLDMWMDRIEAAVGRKVSTILDLGCGTGRFTAPLSRRFNAAVIGVDPSEKMLEQASAKFASNRIRFLRGPGEAIPCADACVDLVFTSMTFHHFHDPGQVAKECHRVLAEGGLLCVRNSTRDRASPYEAYFPNYRRAHQSLSPAADILAAFTANGFSLQSHDIVPHLMANSVQDLAEKAAFRADSILLRLSNDDFEHGLAAMRTAAKADRRPQIIDIDLFVFAG